MNKLEHILNKLRKLMDLEASARQCGEEGEANAAAAGISRLLAEYDLTLQDIPDEIKPVDPIGIERIEYQFKYRQYRWYWDLLDVVAEHNSCSIIRTRDYQERDRVDTYYQVIGRKKNREVVLYLISFLANKFIHIGRSKYPAWKMKHIRETGTAAPAMGIFMKDFLSGCVIGVDEKFREEKKNLPQDKLNALVLANKTEIEEFMKDMNVKDARSRSSQMNERIVAEGYKTGKEVEIKQGLEQQGNKQKLLV